MLKPAQMCCGFLICEVPPYSPWCFSLLGSKDKLPGGGNGNPLQYSCLENPMDRGASRATVYGLQRVQHDWVTNIHSRIDCSIIINGRTLLCCGVHCNFPDGSEWRYLLSMALPNYTDHLMSQFLFAGEVILLESQIEIIADQKLYNRHVIKLIVFA